MAYQAKDHAMDLCVGQMKITLTTDSAPVYHGKPQRTALAKE